MKEQNEKSEYLAAHALDALNKVEAQELAAEIAEDDELAAELEDWRNVVANLAYAVPPVEPSPSVRSNLLAAIKTTPQKQKKNTEDTNNGGATVEKQKPTMQPEKTNVISFPTPVRSARSFWNYAPTLSAIAASIVAVFLGAALYNTSQNNLTQVAELNQKLSAAEQRLNETQTQLERERQERELIASPASAIFALNGTKEVPTAKARLVFDPQTGEAVLFVEGLPDAPQGKAYQIWWITDPKKPAPGGTFKTGCGRGELRDQIPQQYIKAGVFAVTLEPEGGSPAPTGSVVLINNPA